LRSRLGYHAFAVGLAAPGRAPYTLPAMAERRFLITAALPYSNGRLHVGHIAGAYLPADIYVRYLRAHGDEVRFICGSDDNGVAIPITAIKENATPQEVSTRYNNRQAADFKGLGIDFDIFGGTHQPDCIELHEKLSGEFFTTIHEKGFFTKKRTKQLYDPQADKFLPDRYVKGTCHHCGYEEAYGDQCEQCSKAIDPLLLVNPVSTITGTRPEVRETTHWYLRLDQFEGQLADWLNAKKDAEQAGAHWRNTVLNFSLGQIKQGLPERAMTRDLDWGVPVPLTDPDAAGKCLYVWFDAPIGYVSFTARHAQEHEGNADNYVRWWKDPACKIVHFIGEDNTIFHALIWPAMLMAEGSYQLPHNVVANAFLNIKFPGKEEAKISKSRGTAIWIEEYLKRFDPDPLRYYLTAIAPEHARTAFDIDDFVGRNNNELGNALGNFVNRSLTFTQKYFDGKVPDPGETTTPDTEHREAVAAGHKQTETYLEQCRFKAALATVMEVARHANGYFDVKQPWKQRKDDFAACGTTLYHCLSTVKALATLIAPFLPFTADKILSQLNLPASALQWDAALTPLEPGHTLGTPEILFKKIDPDEAFAPPAE
jgi:methionyl-tRNA synthetase